MLRDLFHTIYLHLGNHIHPRVIQKLHIAVSGGLDIVPDLVTYSPAFDKVVSCESAVSLLAVVHILLYYIL
jgi:hypothetical protein